MSAAKCSHTFGKEDTHMSRIGKMPITVPAGVEVKVADNQVTVKGPKGTLTQQFSKELDIKVEDGVLTLEFPKEETIKLPEKKTIMIEG